MSLIHTTHPYRVFDRELHGWYIVQSAWAVNGNLYDDGWNLNAYSVENANEWNASNQFCSRNSNLSSASLWCGSFL